jgi:hypothetical protein
MYGEHPAIQGISSNPASHIHRRRWERCEGIGNPTVLSVPIGPLFNFEFALLPLIRTFPQEGFIQTYGDLKFRVCPNSLPFTL